MTDRFLSTDAFLVWHDWVRVLALAPLLLVVLYALFQFVQSTRGGSAKRKHRAHSLRTWIIFGLMLVGTVPAMSLGLFLAERSAHLRQDRLVGRMEESAATTARAVDQFIDKHRAGVMTAASAASAAGNFDRQSMTQWLLIYHEIYPDFLTMLSADSTGNIVTATSNMTGLLTPVPELLAHNVADRPYFQRPMENGGHFISRVFQGRDLGRDPIVAVSAPLLDREGQRLGIVEGSLNLRMFKRLDESRVHSDRSEMILVDQDDRVIYASRSAGFTELESISSDPLIKSAAVPGKGYEFVTNLRSNDNRFVGASATTHNGWSVYFRAPLAQISQQMMGDYLVGGFALFCACVMSLLLAGGIVRRVTHSVSDMNNAIASFRLDGSEGAVRTPANTPIEFRPFFKQMRKRSAGLRRTHKRLSNSIKAGKKLQSKLTQSIALKEVEVADRTAELEDANRKLSRISKIDALTGIPNRREFDAFTRRIWRVGARDKTSVAIILMDIDYFKVYNDRLGHQAGDDCLCKVAQAIKSCARRPLDLVARYGGEEFVAVLGGTTTREALIVAERLRSAVSELQIPHPGSASEIVTISVGVASAVPMPENEPTETIKAADEALYEAKAAGRNCVVYSKDDAFCTQDSDSPDRGTSSIVSLRSG